MRTYRFMAVPAALLFAGCAVGPNYKRPQVAIPAGFRAPEALP
jgi:hypothetical protein